MINNILTQLKNINTDKSLEPIKIKIQGFLYEDRESIFNTSTLPPIIKNYTKEDLLFLSNIVDKYKELFKNSLGILSSSLVQINDKKCIACQRCIKFCPSNALSKIGVDLILDYNKCIRCGICLTNCSFLAINSLSNGLGIYLKNPLNKVPYVIPKLQNINEIDDTLYKIDYFYKRNKIDNEYLFQVVERLGFQSLIDSLS